jgi:hypothetical protein
MPPSEHSSVALNSVTITDSSKFERQQRKLTALCQNTIFQDIPYCYDDVLGKVHLQTLHIRLHRFDALLLTSVYNDDK